MKTINTETRVMRDNASLTDEGTTIIGLCDLGSGAFVTISQPDTTGNLPEGVLAIDASEWPAIRAAIDGMLAVAQGIDDGTLQGVSK